MQPTLGRRESRPGALRSAEAVRKLWQALALRPALQDAVTAAILTAASLMGVATHLHVDIPDGAVDVTTRVIDGAGIALVLLQTIPLAFRRRAPVLVLAITTTALFCFSVQGYFASFAAFGSLIALYTVAAHRDRNVSIPAGIASVVVVALIVITRREPTEIDAILAESLAVGAAWFAGDAMRIRRIQVIELEDRAVRLEREREQRARQAVADERRVIARELHDVVAHNVSVIVAQAGAAQQVAPSRPGEALATLTNIEYTGREALVEMRRLMGLLRTESDRSDSRVPQPGMASLGALAAQVRDAGVDVAVTIDGTPHPLPVGLDLSAFRIVQEALTNVLKHAAPARACVRVRYLSQRLDLFIDDDGRGSEAEASDGHLRYGHLGMRERVALFGGTLDVGPRPGGGFRVHASLPLTETDP